MPNSNHLTCKLPFVEIVIKGDCGRDQLFIIEEAIGKALSKPLVTKIPAAEDDCEVPTIRTIEGFPIAHCNIVVEHTEKP